MKVAITGHSAGIGQALAKLFETNGHEVVGLSRRNGYNIRSLPKVASLIETCDMLINNAQVGFAQTELLFEVWRRWEGQTKTIVNISTQMTDMTVPLNREWDEYIIQKKALELAEELLTERNKWPKQIMIKPGNIATQPGQEPPLYKDVDVYAQGVYEWIAKNT